MDYTTYKDWFETLATRLVSIAHNAPKPRFLFYVDNALPDARKLNKIDLDNPCIILFPFSSNGEGANAGSTQEKISASFSIVKSHAPNNPAGLVELIDQVKPIAFQVLAALKAEGAKQNGFCSFFTGVEWEGEPQQISTDLYGYTITFHFVNQINLSVNQADYLPAP
jgi:hypothetical protein